MVVKLKGRYKMLLVLLKKRGKVCNFSDKAIPEENID